MFAVLAQFERTLVRERTNAGLTAARARGRYGGAKMKTTPQQDKQLHALWESREFTGKEIAKQFGISEQTFWRRVRPKSLKTK